MGGLFNAKVGKSMLVRSVLEVVVLPACDILLVLGTFPDAKVRSTLVRSLDVAAVACGGACGGGGGGHPKATR